MFNWTTHVIAALVVIVSLSALTMPAGIGGGILFVPVLRLIGGLGQSQSSSLSQVLITGASIGSIVFQVIWQYRHPQEPLLAQPYYVMVTMPSLLSGSLVGVYLNNVLPPFVSLLLLVVLCVVSAIVIFKKGLTCYLKEDLLRSMQKNLLPVPDLSHPLETSVPPPLGPITNLERELTNVSLEVGLNVPPTPQDTPHHGPAVDEPAQSYLYDATVMMPYASSAVSISSFRRMQRMTSSRSYQASSEIVSRETTHSVVAEELDTKKTTSLMKFFIHSIKSFVAFVAFYSLVLVTLTILRGSRTNPSFAGIEPCGATYWVVTGIQVVMGVIVAVILAPREISMILSTFTAGVIATITGASGGIMLNPMFLHVGLDPQQVAATSTIIMLIMASCSALEFFIAGKIDPILSTLTLVTLGGAVVGMTCVSWLVKKTGRQSLLVFLLAGLVVVGGSMLIYIGISDFISTYKEGGNPFELGELC